jgi:hypothetical protein
MMSEDFVVNAVERFVVRAGWVVASKAYAHQHGDDLVATRSNTTLRVEAKGGGSSKPGTRRFGESFTGNQVKTHVSVAILRAMSWFDQQSQSTLSGLAFPRDGAHLTQVTKVKPALDYLRIGVFWVSEDGAVQLDAMWNL